ncbi:hypothetical protein [Telluribacter humicola]|uniref:hypothetical protein n=1 Tax=Telluribacter humicola TaxID=1720261 RepID=UPI001A975E96|nr:hypothetical protein [Telluribacter humicola]
MGKLTDVDKIFECLRKGQELPATLEARYQRLNHARELLYGVEHMNTQQICKSIAKKFQITVSAARLDVVDAKRLFPFLDPVDRDFEKSWLIHDIKATIQAARKKGDHKARAAAQKNLISIFGFDKDLGNQEPPSLTINVLNFNPALIGAKELPKADLDKLIDAALDADAKQEAGYEDIDWEDVKTEENA